MSAVAVARREGRPRAGGRRRRTRLVVRVAVGLLALAVLYVAVTFVQVWAASRKDEAQDAGAIIVLGAAQYDGTPSPVLRSRLDHALELYEEGRAPIVVVTGGRQPGDRFTEATASATYLTDRGVPQDAIRREVQGRSSWESLAASARFLADEGVTEVILVSDPYHSLRLEGIAAEVGLDAHVSPTDTEVPVRALVRETAAVAVGRLIGYNRLTRG